MNNMKFTSILLTLFALLAVLNCQYTQNIATHAREGQEVADVIETEESEEGTFANDDLPVQGSYPLGVSPRIPCRRRCRPGEICIGNRCVPDQRCATIKCFEGFTCVDARCVPDFTNECTRNNQCPRGSVCKNRRCKYELNVCPVTESYNAYACTNPRPNDDNCPGKFYAGAIPRLFCGVLADGTYRDFDTACSTCKDPSIVYFFQEPCHKIPFVCKRGQKCQGYYCSQAPCGTNEDCPYDWQICAQNKCYDKCRLIYCGGCKFGQCGYQEPGLCQLDNIGVGTIVPCRDQKHTCIANQCYDLCERKACPRYQRCQFGNCQPGFVIY